LWALLAIGQAAVTSAITGDGTLGTTVTRSGTSYIVTGGSRPGNGPNLFLSFDRFSVGTGDTAIVTFPALSGITNVLSRVTGGQPSVIDGRLQVTTPGANLYLLNPSGVLFGPNAAFNVNGSFYVSTADFLRFADGARFFANLGQASALTVAPPTAFGFLGNTPAPITMQGTQAAVATEKALSVVGGDITLAGGFLSAASGRIQLASVASPGEVTFAPLELAPDLRVEGFARLGRITLSQGVNVTASSSAGAGTVLIRGGRLLVDNAVVNANTTGAGAGDPLGIDVRLAEDVVLTYGGQLRAVSAGAGRAGDVQVTAGGSIAIGGQSGANRSGLFSIAAAGGDVGDIVVSTPTLHLEDGGQILTSTVGDGRAGEIALQVGRLTVTQGGRIDSSSTGAGPGGMVTIGATDTIVISGRDRASVPSGLFANTTDRGAGGSVQVTAPHVQLRDGGTMAANSSGAGAAGTLRLQVGETFRSERGRLTTAAERGGGGPIVVQAGRLVQLRDSEITTSIQGGGRDAGNLTISAPWVVIVGSRSIANAFAGPGGNLAIDAEVFLADPSSLLAASGTLEIAAAATALTGTLAPLPQTFVNVAALLPARCAARYRAGTVSSFVLGGRGGLPADPSGMLPSPLVLGERLVADPALTGDAHRPPSAARFALLASHEQGLPRLAGECVP
jgi:filamentous hemagglutinin family protein